MNTKTNHGAPVTLERIEATFTLPTPPPGMQWHRTDGWTAEMLPPGTRPLARLELPREGDEQLASMFSWIKQNDRALRMPPDETQALQRTTRPLVFTHKGKQWTWHRPGDPMPCDGGRSVIILGEGPRYLESQPEKGSFWLWQSNTLNCIGWRYADAVDPYAELKAAHAAGKVIQLRNVKRGRHEWVDIQDLGWNINDEGDEYRIKPDDSPPWIEWHGGPCPLNDDEVEEWQVKRSNGKTSDSYKQMKPSEGSHWRGSTPYKAYRVLKTKKPAPKQKLGPEDVPPNSVFRIKGPGPERKGYVTPSLVDFDGCTFAGRSSELSPVVGWSELKEGWLINRPSHRDTDGNPTLWEKCSKEVPA